MLRHNHKNGAKLNALHSIHLQLKTQRDLKETWGFGWRRDLELPIDLAQNRASYSGAADNISLPSLNGLLNKAYSRVRCGRIWTEAIGAADGLDDYEEELDTVRWQRPMLLGGYVSHREQWL